MTTCEGPGLPGGTSSRTERTTTCEARSSSPSAIGFVMDETGTARRGSGEGGTYERTSDGVVFRHLFHLSVGEAMPGLAEAPLRMVARGAEDAPLEPTRVDVEGDVLTLFFPSGNRMTFLRAARRGKTI